MFPTGCHPTDGKAIQKPAFGRDSGDWLRYTRGMLKEIQDAVVGLTKMQLDLYAQVQAHQVALEALAREISQLKNPEGDEPFDVEEFRNQIAEVTKSFRSQLAIGLENLDPSIAARLDEDRGTEESV